jgi:hypothetical protein
MKTIVIIGGIILAGATVIAVVQNNKRKDEAPSFIQTQAGANVPVSAGGSPMLNPAHGLAGHRCDLPVGAPLSASATTQSPQSLPANPAATQGISVAQPVQAQSTQQASAAPAGLKINPAHGQPGHRCDIAVGASLSTPVATQPSTQAPQNMNISTPASQSSNAAPSSSAKLNPAHGLPSHRCDIPVGAPLI